ncbi:MAG: hypothetical protein HY709_00830 [Candidatus Latescibacteria bacterium]|nr:hypothetical protein [Candidatus Latescibacterota bacterium]
MPGVIATYDKLRQQIGEETAQTLVEYIETAVREGASTKEDVHNLEKQMTSNRIDLESQIVSNRVELERRIEGVKVELERRIDRLERRFERFFYAIIFLLVLFNGDKVISFLSGLLGLTK